MMGKDKLQELIERIKEFSDKTFPESTVQSKLLHLKKEIVELINEPDSMEEWADVIILFLNAWAHNKHSSNFLYAIIEAKMDINDKRKWGKPDENGIVEHIKE
jgi:hypothetical protein